MAFRPEIPLTPEQAALLHELATLNGMDDAQVQHELVERGLTALRFQTAVRLYTTTSMSTGEIAEKTRINRGLLLNELQELHVQPYQDPRENTEALFRELDRRLMRRIARWPRLPNSPPPARG